MAVEILPKLFDSKFIAESNDFIKFPAFVKNSVLLNSDVAMVVILLVYVTLFLNMNFEYEVN